jgi:putative two-component system response regulator
VMANMREGSGAHFDPRLVERFVSILPEILEIKNAWDAREVAESH